VAAQAWSANINAVRFPIATKPGVGSAKQETAMLTKQMQAQPSTKFDPQPSCIARARKIGRGVVMAGALAALSLTAVPTTAQAGNPGVGAAIGLGILGGVIAGAAIAATTPPVYAAPPSYYYPQQEYYYNSAPTYYNAPQPYYGPAGYSYPTYNNQ
jgi:hypothetical protein